MFRRLSRYILNKWTLSPWPWQKSQLRKLEIRDCRGVVCQTAITSETAICCYLLYWCCHRPGFESTTCALVQSDWMCCYDERIPVRQKLFWFQSVRFVWTRKPSRNSWARHEINHYKNILGWAERKRKGESNRSVPNGEVRAEANRTGQPMYSTYTAMLGRVRAPIVAVEKQ